MCAHVLATSSFWRTDRLIRLSFMSPPANNRIVVDERSAADAYNANQARLHLRRKAVEFDEADGDGDQEVDFEEFCQFILPQTGERSETRAGEGSGVAGSRRQGSRGHKAVQRLRTRRGYPVWS